MTAFGSKGAPTPPTSPPPSAQHAQPALRRRLRLIQVQAFHRHGHRTAASMFHSLEDEQPLWEHVLGDNARLKQSDSTTRQLERHLHGCSIRSILPSNDHGRDTPFLDAHDKYHFLGRLTPLGEQQMRTLGNSFRERYVYTHKLLPYTLDADLLSVQSTLNRRTVYSLNFFLLGLYPLDQRKSVFSAPIQLGVYSNARDEVLWPIWSPRFAEIEKETFQDPPRDEIVRLGRLFEPRYRSNSIYFWARVYDILYSRLFVKRELPLSLSRSEFSKIEQHFVSSWNAVFKTKEAQRIAMGRCISIILRRFQCALGHSARCAPAAPKDSSKRADAKDCHSSGQMQSHDYATSSSRSRLANDSTRGSNSSQSHTTNISRSALSSSQHSHARHNSIESSGSSHHSLSYNSNGRGHSSSSKSKTSASSMRSGRHSPAPTDSYSASKSSRSHVDNTSEKSSHTGTCPSLFVGSCHDNSLFALLKILTQQKTVKWPRFASCLTLELYETADNSPPELFVQVLMNFRPVRAPCKPVYVEGRDGEIFFRFSDFSSFLEEFVPGWEDDERKSSA